MGKIAIHLKILFLSMTFLASIPAFGGEGCQSYDRFSGEPHPKAHGVLEKLSTKTDSGRKLSFYKCVNGDWLRASACEREDDPKIYSPGETILIRRHGFSMASQTFSHVCLGSLNVKDSKTAWQREGNVTLEAGSSSDSGS